MKTIVLLLGLLGLTLTGLAQQPKYYIDSIPVGSKGLQYINPAYIRSINVATAQRAVYVFMKPGHQMTPLLRFVQDTIGSQAAPVVYIVDDELINQPDSAVLDRSDVRDIHTVKTTDAASARGAAAVTLVLITTSAPKPPPPPAQGTIILKGRS